MSPAQPSSRKLAGIGLILLLILLWAAKGYPADVATAVASERAGLAGRAPGQEQGL